MFAESIHSVADTVNQIILAFGLHKSAKVSFLNFKQIFILSFIQNANAINSRHFCFFSSYLFVSLHVSTPN